MWESLTETLSGSINYWLLQRNDSYSNQASKIPNTFIGFIYKYNLQNIVRDSSPAHSDSPK